MELKPKQPLSKKQLAPKNHAAGPAMGFWTLGAHADPTVVALYGFLCPRGLGWEVRGMPMPSWERAPSHPCSCCSPARLKEKVSL